MYQRCIKEIVNERKLDTETVFPVYAQNTPLKNGVAAVRQEAFRTDRHFYNASNDLFDAIIPQSWWRKQEHNAMHTTLKAIVRCFVSTPFIILKQNGGNFVCRHLLHFVK